MSRLGQAGGVIAPKPAKPAPKRVALSVQRTVTVLGTDDKPAIELSTINGDVKVSLLPKNGTRRSPVRFSDLHAAITQLGAA